MWRLALFWLSANLLCRGTTAACGPVEEGQPINLTCTVGTVACGTQSTVTRVLGWKAESVSASQPFVTQCTQRACGGTYISIFPTVTTGTDSTLTINSVSRLTPFNMETEWVCSGLCNGVDYPACNKLVVYAKPQGRSCRMREDIQSGDIKSVTITCSTTKVYPKAGCSFERITNGGNPVSINQTPTYDHPTTTVTPAPNAPVTSTSAVYYMSEGSVTVPVKDLGEGTHSFQGYIYPDVTGGKNLVDATTASETVTLRLPQASHECSPQMIAGYFNRKSASCTCILQPGYPRGRAQWYKGNQRVSGVSDGVLDLTFDSSNPEQEYTCKGVSDIGESQGTTVTAKFAFFDQNAIDVQPSPPSVNLCGDTNNQVTVTCRVSVENVYPAPSFSFSLDGLEVVTSQAGSVNNGYYQHKYSLSSDNGGVYTVSCRVTNTFLGQTQQKETSVTFRKPPLSAPQIIINNQRYLGTSTSNIVNLAAGYTGDATCRVEGGYPTATTTKLTCGSLEGSGPDNVAILTFQTDQLTKDMDESVCTCTSQHASSCYDKESTLELNVTYVPVVTFTTDTASLAFSEGDTPTLTCSVDGNPSPSVSLVRQRTQEQLASGQGNLKTTELTHKMDPLSCLDTDVYVCSGQNSRGTMKKEIHISVQCPQQLKMNFPVNGRLGGSATFSIEIYGYPEPSTVYLVRTNDNAYLTGSTRHMVHFRPSVAPFGFVDVTISGLVREDFTNYIVIIDNLVDKPLTFEFSLLSDEQVLSTPSSVNNLQGNDSDGDGDVVALIIGIIAAVIIIVSVTANIILVRCNFRQKKTRTRQTYGDLTSLTPDQPHYAEIGDFIPAPGRSNSTPGGNVNRPGLINSNSELPVSATAAGATNATSNNAYFPMISIAYTTARNTNPTVTNTTTALPPTTLGDIGTDRQRNGYRTNVEEPFTPDTEYSHVNERKGYENVNDCGRNTDA